MPEQFSSLNFVWSEDLLILAQWNFHSPDPCIYHLWETEQFQEDWKGLTYKKNQKLLKNPGQKLTKSPKEAE